MSCEGTSYKATKKGPRFPAELILVIFAVFASGCLELKKSEPLDTGTTDTVDTPDKSTENEACDSCTKEHCKDAIETCFADLWCKERQKCFDECHSRGSTTGECDEQCMEEEWGTFLHTDVSVCQGQYCPTLCDRQCGGFMYRVEECASCVQAHCCQLSTDCASDSGCRKWFQCFADCTPGDWGCYEDCRLATDSEGSSIAENLKACQQKSCTHDCGIGKSWTCVGKTEAIYPDTREMTLSLEIFNIAAQPVEGVAVVMCSQADPACKRQLASGQSAADGVATLDFQIDPSTMKAVRFEITKPGYLPGILTYSKPLSGSPPMILIVLFRAEDSQDMAAYIDEEVDPEDGTAILALYDCTMHGAPGLVVSTPDVATPDPIYSKYLFPDYSLKQTSSDGIAVLVGLEQSPLIVEAFPFGSEDNAVLKHTIDVYPKTVSYVVMWPE